MQGASTLSKGRGFEKQMSEGKGRESDQKATSLPPLRQSPGDRDGGWGKNSRPRLRYSGTNRRPVPSNPYPAGLRRLPAPRDLSTASLREKRSSQPWSISTRAAVGVEGIGAGTRATGEEEHVRRQPGPTCPAPGGLGS